MIGQDIQWCKHCGGTGLLFFRNGKTIPCDICDGTGMNHSNLLWIIQGSFIKSYRFAKQMTLRETARKHGIDPSNLYKMEKGKIKPQSNLIRIACLFITNIKEN